MGRDENVTIFKDTEKLCNTNPRLSERLLLLGYSNDESRLRRVQEVCESVLITAPDRNVGSFFIC